MKKNLFLFFALPVAFGMSLAFSACSNDPETPIDETLHKDHGDPAKAVVVLTKGTLNGTVFTAEEEHEHEAAREEHHHDELLPDKQTVTYELQAGTGWAPAEGSATSFRVLGSTPGHQVAYGLTIRYYDKSGKDITGQFVENNQDQIHQHFFIPKNVRAFPSGQTEADDADPSKMFAYTYLDTTPWDQAGAAVTGDSNPIGFKGALAFGKNRKNFTLGIELMHARVSKFKDGKTSPYYAPSRAQKAGDHWDVQMAIPVTVLYAEEETKAWTSGKDVAYEDLKDNEKRIITAIAEGLGLTAKKALKAYRGEGDEEAEKAVLTLAAGHFHGVKFHQDADVKDQQYMKAVQQITLKRVDGKWTIAEDSERMFRVKTGTPDVQSAYGLWIAYYDKNGNDITGDFVEDGEDQKHQHFFTAHNVKPTKEGVAEENDKNTQDVFKYVYMDTDPWNKTLNTGARLVGSTYRTNEKSSSSAEYFTPQNPIGFKGFFEFRKDRKTFDLRIRLMHATASKFTDGATSPYYEPSKAQLASAHWDVDITVPVMACYSLTEELKIQLNGSSYDELEDFEKRIVRTIAEAYNISNEAAYEAYLFNVEGEKNAESGSLWF